MRRLIKYEYYSWTEGCECCSNSSSTFDMWEDGVQVAFENYVPICASEQELRDELIHLEPFDIHSECRYY